MSLFFPNYVSELFIDLGMFYRAPTKVLKKCNNNPLWTNYYDWVHI